MRTGFKPLWYFLEVSLLPNCKYFSNLFKSNHIRKRKLWHFWLDYWWGQFIIILQCKYHAWNKLLLELVCQILICPGKFYTPKLGACVILVDKCNLTFSYSQLPLSSIECIMCIFWFTNVIWWPWVGTKFMFSLDVSCALQCGSVLIRVCVLQKKYNFKSR